MFLPSGETVHTRATTVIANNKMVTTWPSSCIICICNIVNLLIHVYFPKGRMDAIMSYHMFIKNPFKLLL